jgi:hypothetical protein
MPRSYSVTAIQLAIDAPAKWVDNVLAHHDVPGVARGRRGRSRQVPPRALLVLAVARELVRELQMPIGRAVQLATSLCAQEASGQRQISADIALRVDVSAIERRLQRRLIEAVDVVTARRRGRPPTTRRPGNE